MGNLSSDLISQFAKITTDKQVDKKEEVVYGTIVESNGTKCVQFDGSEIATPISSSVAVRVGNRVSVMVKNHSAVVTGNLTSPSPSSDDLNDTNNKILYVEQVVAGKVDTEILEAEVARIDDLESDNVVIRESLTAKEAEIEQLKADKLSVEDAEITYATITDLNATNANVDNLNATKLSADDADIRYAAIDDMDVAKADILDLYAKKLDADEAAITYLTAEDAQIKYANITDMDAAKADILDLYAKKLNADEAEIKYANIDFTNIGQAAMEYFYAQSGLIKNVVVGDQTIAGELVGVTIRGDLIEGNTVVADKLVIKGEDGLYYKLNTDGVTTEAEQTDYNSLNGQVIRARSITATKIAVEDLVAFDATIGGFNITDDAIYSGVKSSVENTTRGIYLDRNGQMSVGDANNYIRYYKDTDGSYKLEISAKSLTFSTSDRNLEDAINDIQAAADAAIISSVEQFYQSDYSTSLSGGEWSIVEPIWQDGKFIFRRTKVTYGNGNVEYTPSETGVCITGNTGASGAKGEDSTLLRIESSRGTVFKNDSISTTLSAVIYHGSHRITDVETLKSIIDPSAYLQWKWQKLDETDYGVISADDARLGNDGFTFTLSPEDVNTKVTFMCELIV